MFSESLASTSSTATRRFDQKRLWPPQEFTSEFFSNRKSALIRCITRFMKHTTWWRTWWIEGSSSNGLSLKCWPKRLATWASRRFCQLIFEITPLSSIAIWQSSRNDIRTCYPSTTPHLVLDSQSVTLSVDCIELFSIRSLPLRREPVHESCRLFYGTNCAQGRHQWVSFWLPSRWIWMKSDCLFQSFSRPHHQRSADASGKSLYRTARTAEQKGIQVLHFRFIIFISNDLVDDIWQLS